jgi:hypothetical protein
MKTLVYACSVLLLAGCAVLQQTPEHFAYFGGDGSSCEQAVVINNSGGFEVAVLAQKLWIENHYPGCRQTSQTVVRTDGRRFDLIEIASQAGEARKVYFVNASLAAR